MSDVTAERRAVITRAIKLIDESGPGQATAWLAKTTAHDHLKADPAAFRAAIANGARQTGGPLYSAWRVAKQLLDAAEASHG